MIETETDLAGRLAVMEGVARRAGALALHYFLNRDQLQIETKRVLTDMVSQADPEVELLRKVLDAGYPFFGICFGNQLLGRALGFGTYKLKFGHRGINQPVKDLTTGKVEVTAHNHGFAVDAPIGETVDAPFDNGHFGKVFVSHIDLNDDVVEGLQCVDIPAFSVQYHPEAAAGPHDAAYLFDRFVDLMKTSKEENRNA